MLLLDPDLEGEAKENLVEQGMDVDKAGAEGKFDLRLWKDNYLKNVPFCSKSMVDFIDESMTATHDAGHQCIWAAGDMNWAGKNPENSTELVAYEALLNNIKPKFENDIWLCFYDASQFNGRVISEIIRAHPVVLMGRNVFENSLYTPPDELLKELADYRAKRASKHQAA